MIARCHSVFLALLCMFLVSVSALAQTTGATLQGTIADGQGGVLPGATIVIRNTDTGWTRDVVSDARGWYRVAALPPGPYEVKVTMSGFVDYILTGLVLSIGQEATVNHALKLATVSEPITVTGQSPLVEPPTNTLPKTLTRTGPAAPPAHPQQHRPHRRPQQRRHHGGALARRLLARSGP